MAVFCLCSSSYAEDSVPIEQPLKEAQTKLEAEIKAQSEKPSPTPQESDSMKRTMLESVFKRGKALYDAGQYREAADVWELVAPDLADEVNIKNLIQTIRAKSIELERLKMIGKRPVSKKEPVKIKTPELMVQYLEKAFKEMQAKVTQADKEASGQAEIEERQKNADENFRKGQELFESGDVNGALGAWKFITPELEDPEAIQSRIIPIETKYAEYLDKKKELNASGASRSGKLRTPAGMEEYLVQVDRKLDDEMTGLSSAKKGVEKNEADRQAVIERSFEQGRKAYAAGDAQAALEAWRRILPYVSDAAPLEAAIGRIEAKLKQKTAAAQAARTSVSSGAEIAARVEKVSRAPIAKPAPFPMPKPVNPPEPGLEPEPEFEPAATASPTAIIPPAAPVQTSPAAANKSPDLSDIEKWMKEAGVD